MSDEVARGGWAGEVVDLVYIGECRREWSRDIVSVTDMLDSKADERRDRDTLDNFKGV